MTGDLGSTPDRFTVGQLYTALVALGVEPVMDPEYRPDGPSDEDIPHLLGALLGNMEVALAVQGSDTARVLTSWRQATVPHARAAALAARIHLAYAQLSELPQVKPTQVATLTLAIASQFLRLTAAAAHARPGIPGDDEQVQKIMHAAMLDARNGLAQIERVLQGWTLPRQRGRSDDGD